MNEAKWLGVARHALTAAGSAGLAVAIFDPKLGHSIAIVVGALGSIVTAGATIWSTVSPEKNVPK